MPTTINSATSVYLTVFSRFHFWNGTVSFTH